MSKVSPENLSYNPLSASRWKIAVKEVRKLSIRSEEKRGLKHLPIGANTLIWFYQAAGLSFFGYNRDPIVKVSTLLVSLLFLSLLVSVNYPCLLNCRHGIFDDSTVTTRTVRSIADYHDVISGFIICAISVKCGGELRMILLRIQNFKSRFRKRFPRDTLLKAITYVMIIVATSCSVLIGANIWFNDEERIFNEDQTEGLKKSAEEKQTFAFPQSTFKKLSIAVSTILLIQHGALDCLIVYLDGLILSILNPFLNDITEMRIQRTMVSSRILEIQMSSFQEVDSILRRIGDFKSMLTSYKLVVDGINVCLNVTIIAYTLKTFQVFDTSIWVEISKLVFFSIGIIAIGILDRKVGNSIQECRSIADSFNAFLLFLPASLQKVRQSILLHLFPILKLGILTCPNDFSHLSVSDQVETNLSQRFLSSLSIGSGRNFGWKEFQTSFIYLHSSSTQWSQLES